MTSIVEQNPRNAMSLAQIEAGMSKWDLDAYRRQRGNALSEMTGSIADGKIPIKAVQRGRAPRDGNGFYLMTGYFTVLKFIRGRVPEELDRLIGLSGKASVATTGVDILVLREPIGRNDFDLRGYSNTPDGISRSHLRAGEAFSPAYPPAAGIPQWRLFAAKKASHVLTLLPGGRIDVGAFSPRDH